MRVNDPSDLGETHVLHRLKLVEPKQIGARSFFDHLCPLLLRERARLCRELGGRFAFDISGEGGGRWLLDLDRASIVAASGEADLAIRMSAEDFAALLAGTLDGGEAVTTGRMRFTGDQSLFSRLARLTQLEQP
jgi:hypothetical protein